MWLSQIQLVTVWVVLWFDRSGIFDRATSQQCDRVLSTVGCLGSTGSCHWFSLYWPRGSHVQFHNQQFLRQCPFVQEVWRGNGCWWTQRSRQYGKL